MEPTVIMNDEKNENYNLDVIIKKISAYNDRKPENIWSYPKNVFISGHAYKNSKGEIIVDEPRIASQSFIDEYENQKKPLSQIERAFRVISRNKLIFDKKNIIVNKRTKKVYNIYPRKSSVNGFNVYSFYSSDIYGDIRTGVLVSLENIDKDNLDDCLVGGTDNQLTHYIKPNWRGFKIGQEITTTCFEHGQKSVFSFAFFSPGGLGSRLSAHKRSVLEAVAKGEPVPENVKADYAQEIAEMNLQDYSSIQEFKV